MKKYVPITLVLFFITIHGLFGQNPTVEIQPISLNLAESESCTLDVCIDNAAGLGAFEFEITFDSDVVHADAVLLGDFLGSTGRTILPLTPVIDNTANPGSIIYGAASLGTSPAGPSGSGILARIVCTAQGSGSTDLVFSSAQVTDIAGSVLTIDQLTDGRIDVGGGTATPGWSTQQPGTDGDLTCVHALSSQNAWIVGYHIILRTIDGGSNWYDVTSGLGTLTFLSLWAVDQNKALAAGYPAGATHSSLYRTTDGGSTWNKVYEADSHWQNFIFMKNSTTGYFLGDAVNNTWLFMKTTDSGLNWSAVNTTPASHVSGEYTFGSTAYWWDGNNRICFVSGAGWFYSSSDLGATWTSVAILEQPALNSLAFNAIGTTGLIGMGNLGRLARSTDGGSSWSEITPPVAGTIRDIHYENDKFWILIDKEIYSSEDNGDSWNLEISASENLRNLDFFTGTGEISGWAVGSNGLIISYSATSVNPDETKVLVLPEDCLIKQNYPNPFNPNTTISFQMPERARVTVEIFDILGHYIKTLVDEVKAPGFYEVEWNAAGMNSGMYICRMETGAHREMIKLLLMK